MTRASASQESPPTSESAWRRWIVRPLLNQLRQGITPEKLAQTIAIGTAISIFPILGATTLLCGIAAAIWKLNQPTIQLVNYVAAPAQLALLIPFYRAGETMFGQPHVPLSVSLFISRIRADFLQFLKDFGLIALEGIAVWCIVAPILALLLYVIVRKPLAMLATRVAR